MRYRGSDLSGYDTSLATGSFRGYLKMFRVRVAGPPLFDISLGRELEYLLFELVKCLVGSGSDARVQEACEVPMVSLTIPLCNPTDSLD